MCMVFFHGMYTVGYMFGYPFSMDMFDFFCHISPAFAFAFIMMCGISCTFSRSNFRRSLPIIAAAVAVTIVSLFISPEAPIIFGILHLLGVCVLLCSFLEKIPLRFPPVAGLVASVVIFAFSYHLPDGYLGFENFWSIPLPETLYNNSFMALGFIAKGKSYSDYFPLIPWGFAFMSGVFAGKLLKGRYPKFMYRQRVKFFSMLGTNAFIIYVLHQPIIYGISYIITLLSGGI